jgi:hypothetical protein
MVVGLVRSRVLVHEGAAHEGIVRAPDRESNMRLEDAGARGSGPAPIVGLDPFGPAYNIHDF